MGDTELYIDHGKNPVDEAKMPESEEAIPQKDLVNQEEQSLSAEPDTQDGEFDELGEEQDEVEDQGEPLKINHAEAQEEAAPIDDTPDPLADIEAKIAGYPLPTPEIGAMQPLAPPQISLEKK